MDYIIRVEDIPGKGLEFDWNKEVKYLQKYLFKENITEFQFKDPLRASFKIDKVNRDIIIKGGINTRLTLYCSRCLEKIYYSINAKIDRIFFPRAQEEYQEEKELRREDFEVEYYNQEIDLLEIIKEQILLDIPYKVLCRKDCKGLCSICGINLNSEQCRCHINKVIDSRFAVLKNLKM